MVIRKVGSQYKLYSKSINPKTKRRKILGTFKTLSAAKKREQEIEYFKHSHA